MGVIDENTQGLRAGEYDILVDRIITEGSRIHGNKDELIRVSLSKNSTWKEIHKALPKGSIIKSVRHMR